MATIQTQNLDVYRLNYLCKSCYLCYVKQYYSLCSSCFDELCNHCSDIVQCSDSSSTDIADICKELSPAAKDYEDLFMSCTFYGIQLNKICIAKKMTTLLSSSHQYLSSLQHQKFAKKHSQNG